MNIKQDHIMDKKMTRFSFVKSNTTFESIINNTGYYRIDAGFICTVFCQIGEYVHISPYVTIIGGHDAEFTAYGFNNIMAGARIICASDRFDDSGLPGAFIPEYLKGSVINEPVIMEEFSNLGTNAILLPGSRLRKGVLVCAGSLFMGDSEEWGVYKGNPAVLTHKIDGTKIIENAKKLGHEL
jgi:acetyltransferase-like isoleucine patch superfamily enzyme